MNQGTLRRIEFEEPNPFKSFRDFQGLYLDYGTGWLIPNTEIYAADRLLIKINSLGCKGEDPDPSKHYIGIFGDSGPFGIGTEAWSNHLGLAGYQALNASVEGHSMARVLERFHTLQKEVTLSAVVVYTGWHNLVYGDMREEYWEEVYDTLRSHPRLAVCTLFCSLTAECRKKGLAELIIRSNDPKGPILFSFWSDMVPSQDNINRILDRVERYHDFVRNYCGRYKIPIVDLHQLMLPKSYDQIPSEYIDILHPSVTAYPRIGNYVGECIRPMLA